MMSAEDHVAYFGYGSLVNRATLDTRYVSVNPARLTGWRRHWQARGLDFVHPSGEAVALLSIHEQPDCAIEGMLVIDRRDSLEAVNRREAAYDQVRLDPVALEFPNGQPDVELPKELHVYVGRAAPATTQKPKLLQSYLDTVMAGYLAEFGPAGVEGFLDTTTGFDLAIIADRHRPHYGRAVKLAPEQHGLFDALLKSRGASFV